MPSIGRSEQKIGLVDAVDRPISRNSIFLSNETGKRGKPVKIRKDFVGHFVRWDLSGPTNHARCAYTTFVARA